MLLKLVFRIKLSDPKQTVAIPTESRSQTKSLWNKSMWSYLKNLSRKASLEQPVARILVNSLDVNSEEAEPGSQTQPEMSRFKKQMNSDSSRGSPIGYCCPERSYGFPECQQKRERVQQRYRFENQRRLVCQTCQRANQGFCDYCSAVAQVTILYRGVTGVQPLYQIRETKGGYHCGRGNSWGLH